MPYKSLQKDTQLAKCSPAAARFYLQISAKEHPNHTIFLTPFPLVWFYHWKYTIRGRRHQKCCHSSLFKTGFEGFSIVMHAKINSVISTIMRAYSHLESSDCKKRKYNYWKRYNINMQAWPVTTWANRNKFCKIKFQCLQKFVVEQLSHSWVLNSIFQI